MSGAAAGILGELVHQFTDPYALFRELVQNSIDAGSRRVDVVLRYEPGRDGGMASASVRDWGEGMTRDVIEGYLLTKFRSRKEGDLTKIGRFGIGFMSVFALQPDLVVVETGRDGEDWRLLLHPDHRYELLAAPSPADGTTVTIHRQMHVADYRELAARSREAVSRWCRHSEVDVAFAAGSAEGGLPPAPALVREPFTVDAPFVVEAADEDVHVVAGPSRAAAPLHGFYNRGLTLYESHEPFAPAPGEEPLAPGVTFKAMSRLLEHTLTRDNVRHDAGYERVVRRIRELVKGPLRERLGVELKLSAERGGGADHDVYLRCALAGNRPLLGAVDVHFPLLPEGRVDGRELARRAKGGGAILAAAADARSAPLIEALGRAAQPVLRRTEQVAAAAALLTGKPVVDPASAYALANPAGRAPSSSAASLLDGVAALGRAAGWSVRQVSLARLAGAAAGRIHALADAEGVAVAGERALGSPFARGAAPILCLDADHELVKELVGLAGSSPRLAALLALRLVASRHGGLPEAAEIASLDACLSRGAGGAGKG